jgi:hypothetical protein
LIETPSLQESNIFKNTILSRRVSLLFGKELEENNPFMKLKISHLMLIPVVINKKSRALVGLLNGCYTKQDSEILFDSLPRYCIFK